MKMLIGGKKVDSSDKKVIEVINPATQQVIDTVPSATKEDIDVALDNAVKGQKEWAAYPLWKRIEIMEKFRAIYLEHRDELANMFCMELGRPIAGSFAEIDWTAGMMTEYIQASRFVHGETLPVENNAMYEKDLIMTVCEPVGVVVVIVPFNYPVEQMMHKVTPALLMGNSVIVKPATETPLANMMYIELLIEAGVPGNAVQIVTGSGSKIGKWLTDDSRVDIVTFTGSTDVGIQISKDSAQHLHRLLLELGGNDPLVVLADADIDQAVAETIASRLFNTGQTCCACKRILVDNKIKKEYIDTLCKELGKKKVGDPMQMDTDCGPMISEKAAIEVEEQVKHIIEQGGKLILGGKRIKGAYFEPTVIESDRNADVAHDDEIFGPVFTVIGYDTVDEAIEIANDTIYGLSSGVCGKDLTTMMKVAKELNAGGCTINGNGLYRTGDQGFGGHKMSGIGREGAMYSFNEMCEHKNIVFKKVY